MKKNFTLATLFSIAMACCSLNATAADLLDKIIQTKTVRIAVPEDYPPYGFVGSDMQPQGIDIDTAKLIADKLGVKLQLIPVTGPNRVPYLQTGKADMTISSLGKTAERAKVIDYSIAYAPFFDAIFGKSNVKAGNGAELAGKTVSVTRGSMQDEELTTLAPKAIVRRFEDNNSTISSYLSGQTELVAIGTTVASTLKQKHPSLDIQLKVILSNSPCYVGLPKGNPALVAKVNEILRAARADGTIDKLSQKWLGAPAGNLPE